VSGEGTEQLLHVVRDHPWCDAWQLAGLSGVPLRTVYRRLGEMGREGLVWSLRVGVPDVQGRLVAPGRRGLIRLAGGPRVAEGYARAFGLDPMGLGRALLRVRALSWARNLLVSLLDRGQHLAWAISPARVPVGRRSLVLDARGVAAPWPGCHVSFGVLADTGGIAVEGWAGWLRLFLSWAGAQDQEGGGRPALLVLTTYAARAAQLAALWRDLAAGRRGEARAQLFVAAVDELAAGQAGWVTCGGDRHYLWEGTRGGPAPPPRPWPEIEPGRGARGGGLGACTLQGTLGGRRVLRAFRELSRGDWPVLEAVASWPLLRSAELAALLGRQAGQTARSTGRLVRLGVVEATELGGREGQRRLHLSPAGIRLLAATHGMRGRRFGRARRWPVGQSGPVRLYLGAYRYAVRHTLLAVEFVVGLRRLADWWWEAGYLHRLVIWDSVECVRRYEDVRGRRRFLVPDSGGVVQIGREVYPFLLEVDRDRGHRDRLVSKLRRYYEGRRVPGPLEIGPLPRLLVVCRSEGRARQVNAVLVELARERQEPVLDAALTTLERIRFPGRFDQFDGRVERVGADGPGRPVAPGMWPGLRQWRLAGEGFGRPTWCFPALDPGRREAARRPVDWLELDREVRRGVRAGRAQRARRRRERAA
jgi:hypothetical protein